MSKVPARVKHMHPRGKELLSVECLRSSRNLPSKFFRTKTPLSSHSFLRGIMMLYKKGSPFRSRINAGLLGDRETLATKESLQHTGSCFGERRARAERTADGRVSFNLLLILNNPWDHQTLGQWRCHVEICSIYHSSWFLFSLVSPYHQPSWNTVDVLMARVWAFCFPEAFFCSIKYLRYYHYFCLSGQSYKMSSFLIKHQDWQDLSDQTCPYS